MPLYEYLCQKCHRRTEKIESVSGPHLQKCPHCGGKVERMITAPAIQFKGAGWYVTDYASKGAAGADASAEKPSGEKSEKDDKKDGAGKESSAKEAKDSPEKKPVKKK